ncbi:MAG: glycoside hydrolase family 31 protein, partial [Sphingobacteriales bacterium]
MRKKTSLRTFGFLMAILTSPLFQSAAQAIEETARLAPMKPAVSEITFTVSPGKKGLHDLNYKVVLHNYSPPRNLHGSLIANSRSADTGDINHFWGRHRAVNKMVDGWWPDGGEGLSAESRITRHKMYFEGPLSDKSNTRPWSLHRTGYNGAHRYGGWIWSGDPSCTWKTLETHIGVGLNHSVSLSPFWGTDVGGFVPTNELTGELYIRWLQFAAFTSSFRGHGRTWHLRLPWGWNQGSIGPPESSIFDSENRDSIKKSGYPYPVELRNALIEPIARQYLNLRYQLLPYNYTLARETYETGIPPMRAMWVHYPGDENVKNLSDQYMWGADLLLAPVYEKAQSSRRLYLPAGNWYDFWTNEKLEGSRFISRQLDLATMPLYVREGAIIPFDPVRQYTAEKVPGNTTLKIYSGSNGSFTLYEDDGKTQDYLKGMYR